MKYQCVLLGHSPEVIQAKLNTMENCRIVGVTSIGVNVIVIATVETEEKNNGMKRLEDFVSEKGRRIK